MDIGLEAEGEVRDPEVEALARLAIEELTLGVATMASARRSNDARAVATSLPVMTAPSMLIDEAAGRASSMMAAATASSAGAGGAVGIASDPTSCRRVCDGVLMTELPESV